MMPGNTLPPQELTDVEQFVVLDEISVTLGGRASSSTPEANFSPFSRDSSIPKKEKRTVSTYEEVLELRRQASLNEKEMSQRPTSLGSILWSARGRPSSRNTNDPALQNENAEWLPIASRRVQRSVNFVVSGDHTTPTAKKFSKDMLLGEESSVWRPDPEDHASSVCGLSPVYFERASSSTRMLLPTRTAGTLSTTAARRAGATPSTECWGQGCVAGGIPASEAEPPRWTTDEEDALESGRENRDFYLENASRRVLLCDNADVVMVAPAMVHRFFRFLKPSYGKKSKIFDRPQWRPIAGADHGASKRPRPKMLTCRRRIDESMCVGRYRCPGVDLVLPEFDPLSAGRFAALQVGKYVEVEVGNAWELSEPQKQVGECYVWWTTTPHPDVVVSCSC